MFIHVQKDFGAYHFFTSMLVEQRTDAVTFEHSVQMGSKCWKMPVSSGCDVVCVIKKEAVILSAIVAQKPITIFTIPYSLVALMIISMAEVTAMDFL